MKKTELRDELAQLRKRLDRFEQYLDEQYEGPIVDDPPVGEYTTIIKDSNDPGYTNRILVATPSTGLVRMEWAASRYGQVIPCNWSHVQMNQFMSGYVPMRYQVADAQNLIVRELVERDMEWLLLVEHDTIPPPDAFIRINRYIYEKQTPVVSGLYYTRSRPSEPILYRGRGTSFYTDWKFGDLVWCDGVPTGFLLISGALLKTMWKESEPYVIRHSDHTTETTRRVFDTPRVTWYDKNSGQYNTLGGTSDLAWCSRIMKDRFFEKSGWKEYQEMEYPFLVDTNIFCKHIDPDGTIYP